MSLSKRAVLIAAVAVTLPAAAAAQKVEKREYPGVQNYSQVDATVACGGATTPEAVQKLKADGFTSIVNLRLASEPGANVEASKAAAEKAGVKYFHLPLQASAPDDKVVDQFLDVVQKRENQPVFVHCGTANRVGAVWLIKRVRVDGWPVEKATAEAQAIGLSSEPLRKFALDYLSRHPR